MKNSLATFILLLLAGCAELEENHYQTLAEARAAGEMERGWIPHWLPTSATDIREVHNIDTNQVALAARMSASDPWVAPSSCRQIQSHEVPAAVIRPEWWPSDVPPSKFSTYRHTYYSCEAGKAFVAMSAQLEEFYFWRPHGI